MSILLRPLYAKVSLMRPDLEGASQVGFVIQEAVREVCRRTFLARDVISITVPANGVSLTISLPNSRNLLKVHRVDFMEASGLYKPMVAATLSFLEGRVAGGSSPRWYAQAGQMLHLWPKSTAGGTARVHVSYVPGEELDEAPLPELAVTAIEARAESLLLRVPHKPGGPEYQNLQMAAGRDKDYHSCIGNLKAISFYGETGELMLEPEPFPGAP